MKPVLKITFCVIIYCLKLVAPIPLPEDVPGYLAAAYETSTLPGVQQHQNQQTGFRPIERLPENQLINGHSQIVYPNYQNQNEGWNINNPHEGYNPNYFNPGIPNQVNIPRENNNAIPQPGNAYNIQQKAQLTPVANNIPLFGNFQNQNEEQQFVSQSTNNFIVPNPAVENVQFQRPNFISSNAQPNMGRQNIPRTSAEGINHNNEMEQVIKSSTGYKNDAYLSSLVQHNPQIQHIISNTKLNKRYLVVHPDGRVEHTDNIQEIVHDNPNYVLINSAQGKISSPNEATVDRNVPQHYDIERKNVLNEVPPIIPQPQNKEIRIVSNLNDMTIPKTVNKISDTYKKLQNTYTTNSEVHSNSIIENKAISSVKNSQSNIPLNPQEVLHANYIKPFTLINKNNSTQNEKQPQLLKNNNHSTLNQTKQDISELNNTAPDSKVIKKESVQGSVKVNSQLLKHELNDNNLIEKNSINITKNKTEPLTSKVDSIPNNSTTISKANFSKPHEQLNATAHEFILKISNLEMIPKQSIKNVSKENNTITTGKFESNRVKNKIEVDNVPNNSTPISKANFSKPHEELKPTAHESILKINNLEIIPKQSKENVSTKNNTVTTGKFELNHIKNKINLSNTPVIAIALNATTNATDVPLNKTEDNKPINRTEDTKISALNTSAIAIALNTTISSREIPVIKKEDNKPLNATECINSEKCKNVTNIASKDKEIATIATLSSLGKADGNNTKDTNEDPTKKLLEKLKGLTKKELKDKVIIFKIVMPPVIDRDIHTTVYPDGTIVDEITETIWDDEDESAEPQVLHSTKIRHIDIDSSEEVE